MIPYTAYISATYRSVPSASLLTQIGSIRAFMFLAQ